MPKILGVGSYLPTRIWDALGMEYGGSWSIDSRANFEKMKTGLNLLAKCLGRQEAVMMKIRDWQQNRAMWIRVLVESTGEDLDAWNRRIQLEGFRDEQSLRAWLAQQVVTGYAQTLLVMERFGYPDFISASADQLIDRQYVDRLQLRPVFDAIINAVLEFGEVVIQARKTYVSLVSPRRTFARVQPTTKTRLDLGLRLEGQKPGSRLQPSKIHETIKLQISLTSVDQMDAEVLDWLRQAYDENC